MRLPKDVVDRILSFRFCPLNERLAEARFLEFARRHRVPRDVINAIFRPDDLLDPHPEILPRCGFSANHQVSGADWQALADGTEALLESYSCLIDWFGDVRMVEVIESDGQFPLPGVGLLRDGACQPV